MERSILGITLRYIMRNEEPRKRIRIVDVITQNAEVEVDCIYWLVHGCEMDKQSTELENKN